MQLVHAGDGWVVYGIDRRYSKSDCWALAVVVHEQQVPRGLQAALCMKPVRRLAGSMPPTCETRCRSVEAAILVERLPPHRDGRTR